MKTTPCSYDKNYTIFSNLKKDDWIKQLTNHDSHFFVLVKEEVERLFYSTGNYLGYLSFDDLYNLATQVTIRQFNKKPACFLTVCSDNRIIYKKVKQRLVNNCKNLFDTKRKINVLHLEAHLKNQSSQSNCIDFTTEDLQAIATLKPESFKIELKNLYFDLELSDIEYLCKRANFDMIEVLGFDPQEYKYGIKKDSKTNQIFLDFSEVL